MLVLCGEVIPCLGHCLIVDPPCPCHFVVIFSNSASLRLKSTRRAPVTCSQRMQTQFSKTGEATRPEPLRKRSTNHGVIVRDNRRDRTTRSQRKAFACVNIYHKLHQNTPKYTLETMKVAQTLCYLCLLLLTFAMMGVEAMGRMTVSGLQTNDRVAPILA